MEQQKIMEAILTQAGVVGLILAIGVIAVYRLYMLERADRREAWKAYNELAKETNSTLLALTVVLNSVKEKLQ